MRGGEREGKERGARCAGSGRGGDGLRTPASLPSPPRPTVCPTDNFVWGRLVSEEEGGAQDTGCRGRGDG